MCFSARLAFQGSSGLPLPHAKALSVLFREKEIPIIVPPRPGYETKLLDVIIEGKAFKESIRCTAQKTSIIRRLAELSQFRDRHGFLRIFESR